MHGMIFRFRILNFTSLHQIDAGLPHELLIKPIKVCSWKVTKCGKVFARQCGLLKAGWWTWSSYSVCHRLVAVLLQSVVQCYRTESHLQTHGHRNPSAPDYVTFIPATIKQCEYSLCPSKKHLTLLLLQHQTLPSRAF